MKRTLTASLFGLVLSASLVGLQPLTSEAQDLSSFLPGEGLVEEFQKHASLSEATLSYDEAARTWTLTLEGPNDLLEYSQSANGAGSPRNALRTLSPEPGGGLDPTISRPIRVTNLTILVVERGSYYLNEDRSQVGTVSTVAGSSSFEDLAPFIGVNSRIHFSPDHWVLLGGKRYRMGGFEITRAGLNFLPGTEFLAPDGAVVAIPE